MDANAWIAVAGFVLLVTGLVTIPSFYNFRNRKAYYYVLPLTAISSVLIGIGAGVAAGLMTWPLAASGIIYMMRTGN